MRRTRTKPKKYLDAVPVREEFYADGVRKELTFSSIDMRTLAKTCAKKVPKWMLDIFELTKEAHRQKRGRLVLLDNKKFKNALPPPFITQVGQLGCEEDGVCYVVETDDPDYRGNMREIIIHEATHITFGPHPWPSETEIR